LEDGIMFNGVSDVEGGKPEEEVKRKNWKKMER
jgi:hypothetical protein